ncbi:SMP-30/gluconolactonase/LRE family protein [Trinickia terrae]|uniref:SMP-30/gluconolactonase/LRE family protein n=1 Tax=Trinickia terrae TaxID=2571161 RepID=A0A4U1IF24_9BURK|nr:SMP-30/gluconolactonase/LRE family protein [Trinickia terrae]TKC92257.1 SMP-30/gluconolactonase/LRE family protein [Trinickia terrae]
MNAQPPVCVWQVGAELGEGPVWLADERAVYFVDIKRRSVHRLCTETGWKTTWQAPAEPGFLLPTSDGSFVCGLPDGLYAFDPRDGRFVKRVDVEPQLVRNRLNDGFVDTSGYLWFGTMDDAEREASGTLYRLSDDGEIRVQDAAYVITNGPVTSPDNRTLYHTDTLAKTIYRFDWGEHGELSRKRIFAVVSGSGYPDGMAVDADGFVWVALFGGGRIERYSPDGQLAGHVSFPCPNVTKLAFGGDDLRTAYVTTARKGMSAQERAGQPLAGSLFSFRVPTPGLPQMTCTQGWSR